MTNRLQLNWKLDGFVDEQRYYCSETPIDKSNLPAPKAVFLGDVRSYVDTDIEVNKTYYIVISSIKNSIEKVSEVKEIKTSSDEFKAYVVALLEFENNTDDKTGKVWNSRNITYEAVIGGYAAKFTKQATRTEVYLEHADFNVGTADFTIELVPKVTLSAANGNVMVDMRIGPGASSAPLIESDNGNLYVWVNGTYKIGPFANVINQSELPHIALTRQSGVAKLWLKGQLLGSAPYPDSITSGVVHLGRNMGTTSATDPRYDLDGLIDVFRFTKGVARYTENFTPPSEFIY